MNKQQYKTFGELSREEQLELFSAWLDGKEIEYSLLPPAGWGRAKTLTWSKDILYRVKPVTKPSIDWSAVHPDFKWLARDGDGLAFLFNIAPYPTKLAEYWDSACEGREVSIFSSYKPGTCDWEDSLVQRPEGV